MSKRVYFLRPIGQLGPVKIGCSKFPESRLDTFTIWSPQRLELVCSVPGTHKDERTLHAMFAKHRVHGEWFGASKELLALIDHCQTVGALPALPEVVRFPVIRHVGHARRAKGVREPLPLPAHKLAIATTMRGQYESGLTASALSAEHGIQIQTVYKYLRAVGTAMRPRGPGAAPSGVTDVDRATAWRDRYLAGETLQQIADDYDVTRERVRQVLRKFGVDTLGHRPEHRNQPAPLTEQQKLAAELYAQGIRPLEIKKRVGFKPSINLLTKAGVETKPVGSWNTRPDDAEITRTVADLYRAGLRAKEIVERVPALRYPETVYRYLKKAGVAARQKAASPLAPFVISQFRNGDTLQDIAKRFGISPMTVRRLLERNGVTNIAEELKRRHARAVSAANARRKAA
jgi:transposase-like protein